MSVYFLNMKYVVSFFFFILSFLPSVQANFFRNYRVDDGLSHNCVWAVMQDSKGLMWFGTNDGLNRFDGKTFRIYRKKQGDSLSIGHNFIHCIKEISHQRLLVGTKLGLYLYDRTYDNFRHINLGRSREKDASINCIMEDPNGNIWLATHGFGLYMLNSSLKVVKHYSETKKPYGLSTNFIWTVIKDRFGTLWLGTAGMGLIHFDPISGRFTNISDQKDLGISDKTVYSLFCDRDNYLWIGTGTSGLIRYNYISGKVSHYLSNVSSVKSIIEYSDHELIMGSEKGLIKFNRINESFEMINEDGSNSKITDNSIFSIVRDKEGSFWIGTYFCGVNYYSPVINKFLFVKDITERSSQEYIVSSMVEEEDGNILVGTHNDNIYRYKTRNGQFEKACNAGSQNVQCLMLDKDKLYVGLYGRGISILSSDGKKKLGKLDINVIGAKSIFKTSKGDIYIAPEGGGCMFLDRSGKLKRLEKFSNIQVKDIIEDFNGSIWFATHSGLFRKRSDGKWDAYTYDPRNKASLISNYVNCVFQDARYRLWIGTEESGLALFNTFRNRFEKIYNVNSGLPSNLVNSVIDDASGNIWVSTGGGIVRISENLSTVRALGYVGRKVQDYLNCALRASNNRLYFGGTSGFISINPKEFVENTDKPKVLITSFKIFNKEVYHWEKASPLTACIEMTKKIILNHNQSSFSFDFAALSYLSPERNRYAYKLEGFDDDWTYVTDNKASFMNIPPGKYVFRVKGTNNDGVWSEADTSVVIRIKPPFWLSNIMIVFYILLVSGMSVFLIRRYRTYIESKNQEMMDRYQALKDKQMYESQIRFFTNIAHEIRTPLSLITAPLENIIHSGDGNSQTKKNLGLIERNANRLLELINQLLDFRKIEENMFVLDFHVQDLSRIVQKVYDQYSDAARMNKIEMVLNTEEGMECNVDAEAIYKIVSNLLANAMKFAKDRIEVGVKRMGSEILVTVEDNGVGIDKPEVEKIFEPFYQVQVNENPLRVGTGLGLSLSQSLAKKHGGFISVESEYGNGCLFTLKLPALNAEDSTKEKDGECIKEVMEEIYTDQIIFEAGLKVLIVEDNEELRTFLHESLSDSYGVFEAENGLRALDIIEKDSVDIIISDILMPEMNGLELCNIVKNDPAYSHLPIILLSAKTDTSSKIDGLNKGADVYMEKPFSIEQLKAQINSIIDNRNKIRDKFIKSPLSFYRQSSENNQNAEFIKRMNDIILENLSDENFSIEKLSGQLAISRSNFHKKVKSITGMTPNDYIKLIRLNKSAQLLSSGNYRINEVCYLVGFNTPSYFAKCFYEQYGKLPKDFIQEDTE